MTKKKDNDIVKRIKKEGIFVEEQDFKILSNKEERKLTTKEKKEYYQKLREYLLKRKLTNTTPGARKLAPKLKKATAQISIHLTHFMTNKNLDWSYEIREDATIPEETTKIKNGYVIEKDPKYQNQTVIPEGPVIFAHTHQSLLDNFMWNPTTDKHCIILHSIKTKKFLLYSQYNTGLTYVRKGDKEHSRNSKYDMIRLLQEGHSYFICPETTWLLSPNKLHLPLHYGFLDTARKAHVPVVPVVHEYSFDTSGEKAKIVKIHTVYGRPIIVKEEDDLSEKLEEYQEIISTIRWSLIEEKGLFKREDVKIDDYIKFLKFQYHDLEFGGIDVNVERENIFSAGDEFYKFHHINDIPLRNGVLEEPEEVKKLRKINKEHGIREMYQEQREF